MSHVGSLASGCRGIRGATTVEADSAAAILEATHELLVRIVAANGVDAEDVASAFFTVTPDLTAAFPARAARDMGWRHVALLDAQEIPVPGSLPRCVRVLVHWNTAKPQAEIHHVYLRGAASLRPDLQKDIIDSKGGEKT
jgi:chorismate mutase